MGTTLPPALTDAAASSALLHVKISATAAFALQPSWPKLCIEAPPLPREACACGLPRSQQALLLLHKALLSLYMPQRGGHTYPR